MTKINKKKLFLKTKRFRPIETKLFEITRKNIHANIKRDIKKRGEIKCMTTLPLYENIHICLW